MPAAAEGQGQAGVSKQKPTQHQLQRKPATKPPTAQSVLLISYLSEPTSQLPQAPSATLAHGHHPRGTSGPSQVRAEPLGFQAAELPAPQLAVQEKAPVPCENSTG